MSPDQWLQSVTMQCTWSRAHERRCFDLIWPCVGSLQTANVFGSIVHFYLLLIFARHIFGFENDKNTVRWRHCRCRRHQLWQSSERIMDRFLACVPFWMIFATTNHIGAYIQSGNEHTQHTHAHHPPLTNDWFQNAVGFTGEGLAEKYLVCLWKNWFRLSSEIRWCARAYLDDIVI